MTAPLAQRLPTQRPRILQSLPLLPSVVRGRDGLLRIGGTRPHESTLWIDGFNVTDPVTGTTTIDLPNESVKGMAVVREPISATFSGVIGSMASIETTAGTGAFRFGVQGFIPRPRINSRYGLGRIEAFFPRAYIGGRAGIARYFGSMEVNFERVPIPGVTSESGSPASGTTGIVGFSRVDFDLSPRNTLTVEGMLLPGKTSYSGLSPLRQPESSPDLRSLDVFGGRRRSHRAQALGAADAAGGRSQPPDGDRRSRIRRGHLPSRRLASELVFHGGHLRHAALRIRHVGSSGSLGGRRAYLLGLRRAAIPVDVQHPRA